MKKSKEGENSKVDVKDLSFSDLYAMFTFISQDRDRGWGRLSAEAKDEINSRYNEVKSELYLRTYGHNPTKTHPSEPLSRRPEYKTVEVRDKNGNLVESVEDTFVVVKNKEDK